MEVGDGVVQVELGALVRAVDEVRVRDAQGLVVLVVGLREERVGCDKGRG